MFTGIISETGVIKKISTKNKIKQLVILSGKIAVSKKTGDSIAIDGVCLTIIKSNKILIIVEAVPETVARTIINNYKTGTIVNLENPLKIGDELNGHLVQGHIDFTTTVKNIKQIGGSKVIALNLPENFSKYFAFKGSVTCNGVSLTISNLQKNYFEIVLIPQTLKTTNLSFLKIKDEVNIEVDLLSKYLDSLLKDKAKETTYKFLEERNLI